MYRRTPVCPCSHVWTPTRPSVALITFTRKRQQMNWRRKSFHLRKTLQQAFNYIDTNKPRIYINNHGVWLKNITKIVKVQHHFCWNWFAVFLQDVLIGNQMESSGLLIWTCRIVNCIGWFSMHQPVWPHRIHADCWLQQSSNFHLLEFQQALDIIR